jgi:hypothetical protein
LHSAGTERATNYHVGEKRGMVGIDNAGILPKRAGNYAHDDWAAYYTYRMLGTVLVMHTTCVSLSFYRSSIHKIGKA